MHNVQGKKKRARVIVFCSALCYLHVQLCELNRKTGGSGARAANRAVAACPASS